MKLSVIVPVYNEAKKLEEVIAYLFAAPCPIEREWIFINDCSTDGSADILRRLAPKYGYQLIDFDRNQGKGAAIRAGIALATCELVIIQDADFEYDPSDVPALLQPLLDNKADVVFGSRFKKTVTQVHRTYHYFVNRFLTVLSNLFSGIYLTDMETCYKVFRRELLQSMRLKSSRFGIEIELTAYVAKCSARIREIPIHYYPRTRLQGKKINWKDGVAALFHLVRFNFLVSDAEAFSKEPAEMLKAYRKADITAVH
jgi:glycosyltransferase involved in cell wall biosynthesis